MKQSNLMVYNRNFTLKATKILNFALLGAFWGLITTNTKGWISTKKSAMSLSKNVA